MLSQGRTQSWRALEKIFGQVPPCPATTQSVNTVPSNKHVGPYGQGPADVIFVTEDKPHPIYHRENLDLMTERNISLEQALVGFTLPIITLDQRLLQIPITQVVRYKHIFYFMTDYIIIPGHTVSYNCYFMESTIPSLLNTQYQKQLLLHDIDHNLGHIVSHNSYPSHNC
ncbi:hypothetical protein J6590_012862 [Homalodisca vitripennis]|nr:hypothetical protein J6590_012862 [Homalodisca vitripennis]